MAEDHRLHSLDGFRALAIALVIGFHYFARWAPPLSASPLYPYGSRAANIAVFRYGYLGVELFFIISGFVISMTLFRSSNLGNFARKRFARLFPTMLLCSTITFFVLQMLPQTAFRVSWQDFLPSLTFTDPVLWNKVIPHDVHAMDGSYWSLFEEVKFYFWVSLLYFSFQGRNFFDKVGISFALLVGLLTAVRVYGLPHQEIIEFLFAANYLPWFVTGIGFFALYREPSSRIGWILLAESAGAILIQALTKSADVAPEVIAWTISDALFFALLYKPHWLSPFSARPVAAIGMASYSLYLLHQDAGVAMLQLLSRSPFWRQNPDISFFAAGAIVLIMTVVSLIVYRYWEAPAKTLILGYRFAKASSTNRAL